MRNNEKLHVILSAMDTLINNYQKKSELVDDANLFAYNIDRGNFLNYDWIKGMYLIYKLKPTLDTFISNRNISKSLEETERIITENFNNATAYILLSGSLSPIDYDKELLGDVVGKFLSDNKWIMFIVGPKCDKGNEELLKGKFGSYKNFFFFKTSKRLPFHFHLALNGKKFSRMYWQGPHSENTPVRENFFIENHSDCSFLFLKSVFELLKEPSKFYIDLE